jgi:hypothetical protein
MILDVDEKRDCCCGVISRFLAHHDPYYFIKEASFKVAMDFKKSLQCSIEVDDDCIQFDTNVSSLWTLSTLFQHMLWLYFQAATGQIFVAR